MPGMLTGPGSRALLIGSSAHSPESILQSVPSVIETVTALADRLVERAGLDPLNLTRLTDPPDPNAIGAALVSAAESASDVLFLYYVGHGLIGPNKELHLATRATVDLRRGVAAHQALPFSTVREVLSRCRARLIVIGLDCCFSGRASGPVGATTDEVFETTWRHGTYLLASASGQESAWARPGEPHTAFTGELIRLLTEGDPRGPREFTLDALYRSLDRSLAERRLPRPRRQATDNTDMLALAPNPAYRAPVSPGLPPEAGGLDGFSPYQGLTAFGPEDAHLFFGRDELAGVLRARVLDVPPADVPLAVVGASGAGKSSLLGAGLVPALRQAGRPHLLITPGDDPLGRLAERLSRLPAESSHAVPGAIAATPGAFCAVLRGLPRESGRPVVIVDQFEEVFTACADESARQAFIETICAACRGDEGQEPAATVVIGVRADFYGHCSRYPRLVASLEHPVVVGPMTADQLRDVIERPARLSGLALQDGLANLLLRELGATSATMSASARASLPLLSHALLATWQHREGQVLTLAGYHATGGIDHAIAASADAALSRLDDEGKRTARRILLRLVYLQEGTEDTRRVVALPELLPPPVSAAHASTRRVLDEFAAARLITVGENTVQIAHEALIRAWPQLGEWIDANRANLMIQQQLAEDSAAWDQHDRDPAYLYTDTRLVAARKVTAELEQGDLQPLETAFLEAGMRLRRRRTRITRQVIAALSVLLLVATVAGVAAFLQARAVQKQRDDVTSQRSSDIGNRLTDRTLGAQLILAAYGISATPESRGALLSTASRAAPTRIIADHAQAYQVAFDPRGRNIAVAYADGTVEMWDVHDRSRPTKLAELKVDSHPATGVAFSRDGRLLTTTSAGNVARLWDVTVPRRPRMTALVTGHRGTLNGVTFSAAGTMVTASDDKTAKLWSVADPGRPELLSTLEGHEAGLRNASFSADGRLLATASNDHTIRLWDVSDGRRPRFLSTIKGHINAVSHVSFSPDGKTLASASEDWGMSLWNVSRPDRPVNLSTSYPAKERLYGVDFSPDGSMVAAASADNLVYLWNVSDPRKPLLLFSLGSHLAEVQDVVFSPDGHTLATTSSDGATRLWNLSTPGVPLVLPTLRGHLDAVTSLAFSADGRIAVTGSVDRTARLWNVSDFRKATFLANVREESNTIDGVALSRDGKLLATACGCGLGRLWDIAVPAKPRLLATLRSNASRADAVAFAPDGKLLAMACGCGSVELWDLSVPAKPKLLFDRRIHGDAAWDITFSPDGRYLATASADRTVTIWDASNPRRLSMLSRITAHSVDVSSVAFSSDGTRMATASNDGTARIWDVSLPSKPRQLSEVRGHSAAVKSVAFGPGDRMLATASADQTVRLWEVGDATSPRLWAVLSGHSGTVYSVLFHPGTGTLATASGDTTAQFWSVDVALAEKRICETSGIPITREEWRQYLPGTLYTPQCG
ncbi:caspase family protein [Streptosporangium sp. NPDC000563]|uniref:caspase, EACC1-associated type n=1 Tax=Streptosporangium sp. NPDC000563 TaxID=3154366 RepID=UPI003330F43D